MSEMKLVEKLKELIESFSQTEKEDNIPMIKAFQDELMEEVSVVYSPYVIDGHGQWMSRETVEKMHQRLRKGFFEDGSLTLNFAHTKPLMKSEVELKDLWLLEEECRVGDMVAPEGTLVAKVKYHNRKLWEMRKAGVIGGFSVHGKCGKNKKGTK